MTNVTFTPAKLVALKRKRDAARAECLETFMFEGNEYLVRYADYLIEYLDGQFERKRYGHVL